MTNRLATALSPYLRQHADNPVDWREWGQEALAEARRRDVPVFLSVGYAACHWCHVMAAESFSDPVVAAVVNATSVPVKVDREERPDVDAAYMTATIALTGHGGWPMSVWLTPEGEPFHAGTYFPPRPGQGLPSFRQVVDAVAEAWRERRDEVRAGAADIAGELARAAAVPPPGELSAADVHAAVQLLRRDYDAAHPGFGGAPKFPQPPVLDALVAVAGQDGAVADEAWRMARDTCLAMADGGIHDQLAGGFARYSTDRAWIVPHFEKMLTDSALLLATYGAAAREAERRGEDPARLADVADRTAAWIVAELGTPEGAFAASLDADSEDEEGAHREGAYYVWTPAQLRAALGDEDAGRAAAAMAVTDAGSFERGASVPRRDPARPLDERLRLRLLDVRDARPRPARDDKVVTAWNAWTVAALAERAMTADRPDWLAAALRAARFLVRVHASEDGARVARASRDGVLSSAQGVAADHAALGHACAVLAQATGDPAWLRRAAAVLDGLHERFGAEDGGLHDTAADAEALYLRPREIADAATPSAASAALRADRMMHRLTGEDRWRRRADALLASLAELVRRAPRAAGWALRDVADVAGPRPAAEVAVVGPPGSVRDALVAAAWRHAPDGSVVVAGEEGSAAALLAGRPAHGDGAAYVCHGQVCRAPVHTVDALVAELTGG